MTEVAFTLQVLMILIIVSVLSFSDAMIVIFIYILMGIVGIPVFSKGGGFGYFLVPSFGFIIGFIFIPIVFKINSLFRYKHELIKNSVSTVFSLIVLYLFGTIYFMLIMNLHVGKAISFGNALLMVVVPFVGFDILKGIISLFVSKQIKKLIEKI